MKKIIVFTAVCFLFGFVVSFVSAETVILKDGTTYKGNIHHQDSKVVFIVQGTELIKILTEDIQEIKKDEEVKKKDENLNFDDSAPTVIKNNEFIVKLIYDFNGKYQIRGSSQTSSAGLGIGTEFYHYISDSVGIGCGAAIQNPRDVGNIPGKFFFLPMYASVKLRSNPTAPYKYGYAIGQLGYNLFSADNQYDDVLSDIKGGIYYAGGFGFVYNHVLFEILWSVNQGKGKISNLDIDIEYSKYTFSIGYIF